MTTICSVGFLFVALVNLALCGIAGDDEDGRAFGTRFLVAGGVACILASIAGGAG
jgi:hypothetical protein